MIIIDSMPCKTDRDKKVSIIASGGIAAVEFER
jgi:hypothetical protein